MSYRSLFGDDLSQYEVDILIDSGIGAAEWEHIIRSQELRRAYGTRSFARTVRKALKGAGAVASLILPLTRLTINKVRKKVQEGKRLRSEEDESDEDSPLNKFQRIADEAAGTSLLNIPTEDNMGEGMGFISGSGKSPGLTETPVDRPQKDKIARGPPDYQFASLPWYFDCALDKTFYVMDLSFRMTSPVDPYAQTSESLDQNTGTGTALALTSTSLDLRPDPVANAATMDLWGSSARWYDFYKTMYNYYHTVSAKWHVTIENLSSQPMWVHQGYYADTVPPLGASNEDILTWREMESHLVGTHHRYAEPGTGNIKVAEYLTNRLNVKGSREKDTTQNAIPTTFTETTTGSGTLTTTVNSVGEYVGNQALGPILKLSGSYRPGDYKREIRLDSDVENWTLTDANPKLPERLLFRVKPVWNGFNNSDARNYQQNLRFKINLRIEYLVEFKELKSTLRWPIERQPAIVTIQSNPNEDDEGNVVPEFDDTNVEIAS